MLHMFVQLTQSDFHDVDHNNTYIYTVNSIICREGMPLSHQHLPDVPIYVGSAIRGSSWSEKTAWPRLVDDCRVEGTNREVQQQGE